MTRSHQVATAARMLDYLHGSSHSSATGEGSSRWRRVGHEAKFDGCRMQARLDRGEVRLLTSTGADWTAKYPALAATLRTLSARQIYLDGELCGVRPDGSPPSR